jgi:hypothetical protein
MITEYVLTLLSVEYMNHDTLKHNHANQVMLGWRKMPDHCAIKSGESYHEIMKKSGSPRW